MTVCYGEPGAGKTRYAMLSPLPYKVPCFGGEGSTDFFGDYRPEVHQTLVVDDFYSNWKYTTFLEVCDRYPTEVHTKGGFVQLLIRHIVFTSNLEPAKWYPNVLADADRRGSFYRRLHNIIEFRKDFYIVKKGDLPWPCPFARSATAFDLMQRNPPNLIEIPQNPLQSDQDQWVGLPGLEQPLQNPLPPPFACAWGVPPSNLPEPVVLPETYEQFVARRNAWFWAHGVRRPQ